MESDRHHAVFSKLVEYTRSPSLRHIRDPHSLQILAKEILKAAHYASSVWGKWEGAREDLAKAAFPCWIPIEDLRSYLNGLPGAALTVTDVTQRLRAFWEEPWPDRYPNEQLKAGCLKIYEAEKAIGTELPAIIGALQEHIEHEEDRLRQEQHANYLRLKETERVRVLQKFQSGADCGWTRATESKDLYCRRNARTFRIVHAKDNRWKLYRIEHVADPGDLIGVYQNRRDANKVLEKIAYQPE